VKDLLVHHFSFDSGIFFHFTRHNFRSTTCCIAIKFNARKWEKSHILKG